METDFMQGISEELSCPLCLSLLMDPRILACQHTFCYKCLLEYYENNAVTSILRPDSLKCPLCRQHHDFGPGESIEQLPRNYSLANIVEHFRLAQEYRSRAPPPQIPAPIPTGPQSPPISSTQPSFPLASPEIPRGNPFIPQFAAPAPSAPSAPAATLDQSSLYATAPPLDEEQMGHFERAGNTEAMFYNPYASTSSAPPLGSNPIASTSSSNFPPPLPTGSIYPQLGGAPANPSPQNSNPQLTQTQRPIATQNPAHTNVPPPRQVSSSVNPTPAAVPAQMRPATSTNPVVAIPPNIKTRFIAFRFGNEAAKKTFDEWLNSVWWAPRGFSKEAVLQTIEPVFVPHYLSDLEATADLSGLVEVTAGNNKKWDPFRTSKRSAFKRVLSLAADSQTPFHALLKEQALEHFKQDEFDAPQESSLGGWLFSSLLKIVGQETNTNYVPPPHITRLPLRTWDAAFKDGCEERLENLELVPARDFLRQQFRGNSIKNLAIKLQPTRHTLEVLYLPVFVCYYTYENTVYYAAVNGLNSKVSGDRPYTILASVAMGKTGFGGLVSSLFGSKK